MTGLLILLLLFLAVIYGISFGFFKLIWILFKKKRNFWPLVLAGISTFLVSLLLVWGLWWAAQKIITPFKPLIAHIQQTPVSTFGPRLYQDNTFPFELTVFDGMDFSDWIFKTPVSIKLGIDTNVFNKSDSEHTPFLLATLVRYTQAEEEDPFKELKNALNTQDRRLQIQTQEETRINNLPAYLVKGIAYSNQGPLQAWLGAYYIGEQEIFYLLFISTDDQREAQVQEMLQSFRFPERDITTEE